MKISGNTVLITGGGSGIGFALAEALVSRDNRVIICGRDRVKLQKAKKHIPSLSTRVCDVSKHASRKSLVSWLVSTFPPLNVLVNNAGIQRVVDFRKGARDLPDADGEIATNLSAPIHLSAALIPHLKKRRPAAVVNISSGLAFTPLAAVPVYCATKAALHSLSPSLRHQLEGTSTSVRVFEIAPPMVATGLSGSRRSAEDDEYAMTAAEAAKGILRALERDGFESALGAAAGLRKKREALFDMINE